MINLSNEDIEYVIEKSIKNAMRIAKNSYPYTLEDKRLNLYYKKAFEDLVRYISPNASKHLTVPTWPKY